MKVSELVSLEDRADEFPKWLGLEAISKCERGRILISKNELANQNCRTHQASKLNTT